MLTCALFAIANILVGRWNRGICGTSLDSFLRSPTSAHFNSRPSLQPSKIRKTVVNSYRDSAELDIVVLFREMFENISLSNSALFVDADSAEANEDFATVLTEEPGQTSRFAPIPFRGLF